MSLFFFVLIVALATYFTLRYRRRVEGEALRPAPHHPLWLEVTWVVIPTLLVLVIFVWGFRGYLRLSIVPAEAYEVKVNGQKWFWSFDYAEGAAVVNEMVVPVGRNVKLLLSSKDVIHSFFVPAFRIKKDVLPNRYSIAWFHATQVGEYDLYCTEYCGSKHSAMLGKVKVVGEREFADWLDAASSAGEGMTPEEYGAKLYQSKACYTCHSLDGSPGNGPTFKGIFGHDVKLADGRSVMVDENYIRESILTPTAKVVAGFQPIMPTYQGLLKDREIDALVAFLKGLK